MKRAAGFFLLLCLLGPGSGGWGVDPLRGQDGTSCLSPIPGDPTPLFVTSRGELCRPLPVISPPGTRDNRQSVGERAPSSPGKALLASMALPGFGQKMLGQGRWTAYAAVELWAWIQYISRRREGRDLQSDYRDLAWLVARRVSSGSRQEGDWEYYEALTKYQSSGAYDSDPLAPDIQPESDESTFNGSMWVLAQEIFFPEDPESPIQPGSTVYEQALNYYASRAYDPSMAWDWGGNPLHQAEYVNLIRSSDENLRRATAMIGVILANHLLSGIDALVSGRLGAVEGGEPLFLLQVALVPGPFATDQLALEFRLPTR